MASFRERYEELFGQLPDYDPIQIDELADQGRRRAIDIQASVPDASPRQAIRLSPPTTPTEPQGAISGLLKTGTGMLAEGLVGIPEYAARNVQGGDAVAGYLEGVRDDLAGWRESVYARMSPEVIDLKGRELMTLDPDKTIWQGSPLQVGEAVTYKLIEQVPMLLATLVPGAVLMRAGASAKGISYLGASEAGLSLGFIQNDIADGINEMPTEELVKESPRFAQLLEEVGEDAARTQLIQEAQGMAPVVGGLLVGAISAAAGRYLKPIFEPEAGLKLGQRVGRGAISEGLFQEGPQESIEQVASNVAAAAYDGDRQALEGIVEAYAQGALLGGIMGGGVAGVFGRGPQSSPETDTAEPEAAIPPAATFEEVFGQGGEDPFAQPPEQDQVPEDVRAAIQANLRQDNLMEDMVDNLNFAQSEQQRYLSGQPTTPTEQLEMLPTAAPSEGPGVTVPPESPLEPEQGVLPLQLRERGRPVLQESPRGVRLPTQLPTDGAVVAEEAPQPELATQDMFNVGRTTPTVGEQAEQIRKTRSRTGNFVVKLYDAEGNVIDEELFDNIDAAEEYGDQLYEDFPDGFVELTPEQEVQEEVVSAPATEPEAPIGGELPAREIARAEAAREAAAPTEGEQAVREATAELPFEERAGVRETAARTKTREEAAKRLVVGAAKQLDKEQTKAVNGFFPPSVYDFNDAKNKARYTKEWGDLLDIELRIAQGTATDQDTENRKQVLKRLAAIRQLDKPRRKVQKTVEVAKKVDEKTVRKLRRNAAKISQKIDTTTDDQFGELEEMTREQVDRLPPVDLDIAYEQAIRYLEGQQKNFDAESHRKARSPSVKRRLILRALNKRRNRAETASRVAGTRFATTSPQGVDTGALTAVTQKADESKADTLKRETRARQVYKVLAGKVQKAAKRLDAIEIERDIDGNLTTDGREALLARHYVEQTMQLASAIIESGQTDKSSTDLAESISKMLDKIETAGNLKLKNLMAKQESLMESFVEQRGGTEGRTVAQQESKATRAQRIAESNTELMRDIKRRQRLDQRWKKSSLYRDFVRPVLEKFTQAYFTEQGYYKPSLEEAQMLQWAMSKWMQDSGDKKQEFYDPLRRTLTYLGFEFDKQDTLVVAEQDGKFVFDPAQRNSLIRKQGAIASGPEEQLVPERGESAQAMLDRVRDEQRRVREGMERADQKAQQAEADRHARATAILAAFRKVVDNTKSTINKLVDAEAKMLADLKAEGFIKQQGSVLAVIRIPGRADFTYRKAGSDLANKRITKPQARRRMQSVNKKYTRELSVYSTLASRSARDLTGLETASTEFEYVYEAVDREMKQHGGELETAATVLGDLLNDRGSPRTHTAVLDLLIDQLPETSFYGAMARKLRSLDMPDVTVQYDWKGEKLTDTGRFYTGDRRVVLSRSNLAAKSNPQQALIHTVVHELMHAATVQSLSRGRRLTQFVTEIQNMAVASARQRKVAMYGLADAPVEEFIAEAFSNPEMQKLLKSTPVDNQSLWDKFTAWVKRVLGWTEPPAFDNAFEALMSVEEQLFARAGEENIRGAEFYDAVLSPTANGILNRISNSAKVEKNARDLSSRFGKGKFALKFMTMDQLREVYEKYFGGETGSLAEYMNAFKARNAKNNELMQLPEKLSRKWTELRDKDPEVETEFSRIATESTLYGLDPSKESSHSRNKDAVKAPQQLSRYKALRQRWNKLPEGYKNLWAEAQQYYQESLAGETKLLLLNALRGVVTKGSGVTMDVDTFSKNYTEKNIGQFDTKEKMKAEFGEYLGESDKEVDAMLNLIERLATVPQMKQGVYFPLMRYGDYVVYASRELPSKYFSDSQAANAEAAKLRAEDPTLTVNVYKKGQQYVVQVKETSFITGESAYEVEQRRQELLDDGWKENEVGDVDLKTPAFDDKATIDSNAALNSIITALGDNKAAQNAIKQFYLRNLADSSFRKREIKRQNRAGVNYDLQHRNFANYAKQSAYYRSQLEFGWQMAKGMSDMDKYLKGRKAEQEPPEFRNMSTEQLRNVYRTLEQRDDLMTDPVEVSKFVRKGIAMTQFYMLTSASYHMINMSQPWMVTLPTMGAKFTWGKAISAMKDAQALIKDDIFEQVKQSKGGFSLLPWLKNADTNAERAFGVFDQLTERMRNDGGHDDVLEMLEVLRKTHVLEVSPLTELREIAGGQTGPFAKALDASRVMAHLVEVNNRVLTAVAAYKLEYNNQLEKGASPEAAKKLATKYAETMVSQTQFNYSTANKPPMFMKWPLLFQFMQWSQHIYAHLIRNMVGTFRGDKVARRALLGVLGTHAAVGGAIGVSLQPIKMAIGLALMGVGDEDEPYTFRNAMSGATFDRIVARTTNDWFGTTVSTALSRGLPAAWGADVSTRMSLGTLYFIDLRGDTPESVLGSLASSFGGAFVNQMLTFGRGLQYIGSGDPVKALESFSPKFLRDILRAGRFATDGLVNNAGDRVLDTSDLDFVDVALQAIGFTPTVTSQFYQGQAAIKDVEAYVRKRKTRLLKEFRAAEPNQRADILRQVMEFNRAYPQERITRSTLLRNIEAKMKREGQYRKFGAAIDERKAELYKGYGEPYR